MPTSYSVKPHVKVLTIAGSDSGGGAGIQADLKTFSALGAYGASVITAVTAQNTQGVQAVYPLSPDIVASQCDSVLSDITFDAVKIGMLPDVATIEVIANKLQHYRVPFIVLDPVLVATSGDSLVLEDTIEAMRSLLMPLAHLLTPNLAELAMLSDTIEANNEQEMLVQGEALLKAGAQAVLLKGGHWHQSSEARDWLIQRGLPEQLFSTERIETLHTHGTGCTLASAIAALYPRHADLATTISAAKTYLHGAIECGKSWQLGLGSGPLAHFWRIYRD